MVRAIKNYYLNQTVFQKKYIQKHSGKFHKPAYMSIYILNLSSTLMYDFCYNIMKKIYGDKARLFPTYTNTYAF